MQMLTLLSAALLLTCAHAANILAPIWFPGPSHFLVFRRLFVELARRGHNVTVLTHYPLKAPVTNYNQISIQGSMPQLTDNVTMEFVDSMRAPVIGIAFLKILNTDMCLQILDLPQVHQLAASESSFDLVIAEFFHVDCLAALAHRFQAPLIGITSSMALPTLHDRVGNPDQPAYTEQYELPLSAPFGFWGRVYSVYVHQMQRLVEWWFRDPAVDRKLREVLGEDTPPLQEVLYNTSLVLVNSHWSVDQPAPTVPGFVEVGGLHLEDPKPLPEEILKFIEDSPNGVIYFSLGSMVRVDSFAPEKFKAIVDVFASLPQRVLWKADPTNLPSLPPNVRAQKWIPQYDVLNHEKVRVFITHGGLLGTQESLAAGVPVLTIPLFSDQFRNAAKAEASGRGLSLTYENLSYERLRAALDALLNDTRYRDRARQLSARFKDRPRPPLEEAVYWVEYVLRHKGAPHLRSAALHLAWYQYLLLDVAAVLLGVACLVLFATYLILRKTLTLIGPKNVNMQKQKTS